MVILAASPALSQVQELEELRLDQALVMQAEDSLIQERAKLLQLGAQVTETVDSLKLTDHRSEALTEASLYAMELNTELGRVNLQLEALAVRHDSLKGLLRSAYDWEMSRLLGLLGDAWDEGLLEQLAIFQDERQALGFDLAATEMRYGPDMTISEQDGPEEIEQKAEIMRDKLHMVRRDLARIDRRLQYLTHQVERVTRLIGQHDPTPRARGALRDMRTARLSLDGEARPAAMESAAEVPARRGRQVPPGSDAPLGLAGLLAPGDVSANPAIRGLQLEVSRLAARRQEIYQFEAVYVDRMETFERRRQALLPASE